MIRDEKLVARAKPASLRGYDHKALSTRCALRCRPESMVMQSFRDSVDANDIIRRFGITRQLPVGVAQGFYGDFTGVEDYDTALDRIEAANNAFMKLPAAVRERFGNSPGTLIRAAQTLGEREFLDLFKVEVPAGS